MATSGTTTWQLNADEIIKAALRKISGIASGQTPTTAQYNEALQALNAMLKSFQVKGMHLWAVKDTEIPLTATPDYLIGIGQTVNTPAPLKVIQATLVDTTSNGTTPLDVITHYDYNLLPKGASTGSPVSVWYEPRIQVGTLHVWPTPDADSITNKKVKLTYQRPFEDMVNTTDNLDFPQHWHEAVIYGLAWRLSPEYGVPINDRSELQKTALFHLGEAETFGTEEGSLFFQPDWRG